MDIKADTRFSLLLLEPGEIYFKDYSVYLFTEKNLEDETLQSRQKGRLKLCTKSLVFEPEDIDKPLLKLVFRECSTIDVWNPPMASSAFSGGNCIRIVTQQTVEMLEHHQIRPYTFIKEPRSFLVLFNYMNVEHCVRQIGQLFRASLLSNAEQMTFISDIVASWHSSTTFDKSCIEDLYEEQIAEVRVSKITPLVTNPGLLLLTSKRVYFQPFNNVEPGLELTCSDCAPVRHLFLSFRTPNERDRLCDALLSQKELKLDQSDQENMTWLWQNGIISNYEYLLYINSLADRSFNDLTQYPVFPWVLSDYTSDTLDLNDPGRYRDLKKPMGAINSKRFAVLKERYDEMGDDEQKFLYGSHYSTPGFVLYYLVRKVPQYMLCLQNGRFDHPDRMFNSVPTVWKNATSSTTDFKELIPEFYDTTPGGSSFLVNKLRIEFGIKSDNLPVGDVELPPWAKDPDDFIRICREALESEVCSNMLHHWIDLIFGYKQTGEEAIKADNVFYYMTYEGAINLDNIESVHELQSVEVQIMEFGQTPRQVFRRPHPPRLTNKPQRSLSVINNALTANREMDGSRIAPISEMESNELLVADNAIDGAAGDSKRVQRRHASISLLWQRNMAALEPIVKHSLHAASVSRICFSKDESSILSVSEDGVLKIFKIEENRQSRSVKLSTMRLSSCFPLSENIIVCSSYDNYLYAYHVEFGCPLDSTCAHDDGLTDIAWRNGKLATSSVDSCAKIWHYDLRKDKEEKSGRLKGAKIQSSLRYEYDHDVSVTCCDLNQAASRLITGTVDGHVTMWEIGVSSQHRFNIQAHKGIVVGVSFSPQGTKIATVGSDAILNVIDVESATLCFTKKANAKFTSKLCWDGATLLVGNAAGELQVWDLITGQHVISIPLGTIVWSVAVSIDGRRVGVAYSDSKTKAPIVAVYQSRAVDCLEPR